ncbi:DUF5825 family protein [Streptomyces halstedii]|uniref:DUF5825 family protein n=1 Tax=Streptomyces TaxID=1883 RepID=UPI0004A95A90|nr:DUF5825 family protein [Streptomyces sp. NTK 937]KDQ69556.1 hypothetical protein DT87_20875 [Streptomyces sp. NTK 937]WSX35974.1 DUF5825 family protein [Streptomyces halstedii]
MSTTTPARTAPEEPLAVSAWRDYDAAARSLPGMSLGDLELTGPVAEACDRLWDQGARQVRLAGAVDLTDTGTPAAAARTVRRLSLVRDLTARAVLVDWELRLDVADSDTWQILNHLQPPRRIDGPAKPSEVLAGWRDGHYLGKCLWRQGPGFVQIRDRRWGDLRRFTADEPHYQEAIERLSHGVPATTLAEDVLTEFREERLVLPVGELMWWVPYRVNRWVQEAMAI